MAQGRPMLVARTLREQADALRALVVAARLRAAEGVRHGAAELEVRVNNARVRLLRGPSACG